MENILLIAPNTEYSLGEFINTSQEYNHQLTVIAKDTSMISEYNNNLIKLIHLEEITDDIAETMKSSLNSLKGVIPGSEFTTTLSDKIAELSGTFFNKLCDKNVLRNKRIMREIFDSAGICQPKVQAVIPNEESINNINWPKITYPIIVKPSDMAGSIFVRKCNTKEEAIAMAKPIFSYERSKDTGMKFERSVLLEEYIQGDEYSAECIVFNNKVIDVYFVKKIVSDFPYCDEIGHITGINISQEIEKQILQEIHNMIKAVNLSAGVLHVEFKVQDNRPYIIEVGNRVAGGNISRIIKQVYGISLEKIFYQIRCNMIKNEEDIPRKNADVKPIGIRFRYFDVVPNSNIEGIQIIETIQKPSESAINYDKLIHGIYFNANRSGYDIFKADNLEKALNFIKEEKMEAIILIWDYELLYKRLNEINNFKKYLILENIKKSTYNKEADKIFDRIFFVDNFLDKEEMSSVIQEINNKTPVKAILSPLERTVETAGFLRDKFKIQGVNEETAIFARNKFKMKNKLSEMNIPVAKYALANSQEDLTEDLNKIGFPAIVKPIQGSGTRNTYIINNIDDFNNILEKLNFKTTPYLIESFIKGTEYHCDSIVDNTGKILFTSVGRYLHNCIDTINTNLPAGTIILPEAYDEISEKIKQLNQQVINILSIKSTVTHLEAFAVNNDIYFNEIAVRIGGGPLIGLCIQEAHGINIYDAFVDVQVFGTCKPKDSINTRFSGSIAFPIQKGKVIEISNAAQYKHIPGIITIEIFNKKGDILKFNKDSTAERTGYSIVNSNDYINLASTLIKMYEDFILEVEIF